MTISAKIIEDSISDHRGDVGGVRLVTLQLTYPRFIHAEVMTHRVFSRNASSSRAIPVAKMLEAVRTEPATPIHWGKNQPGMQASEQLTGNDLVVAKNLWLEAAQEAAAIAERMNKLGMHKQVANRILEPFQHIHVVVTATEWDNFFELRAHKDAQPEIHELALQMQHEMDSAVPKSLNPGEWHLPYVKDAERELYPLEMLLKMSAARCARVSYLTHDGQTPDVEKDIKLYDQLITSRPMHASPIEHQATPMNIAQELKYGFSGNLRGWVQHRKLVEQNYAA